MDRLKRSPYAVTLLALLPCLLCTGVSWTADAASKAPAPSPVIVSTGNTRGIFEPCRCPTNPYGGVARRVTWVAQYRKADPDFVLIDSGDVFDSGTSKTWGELLTWGYRLCGYDAVALGSRDIMYSRAIGAEQFKASGIPWVCGNMAQGREELGVEKYRLLTRGGKRIAVTAFLATNLVNSDVLKDGKPAISLTNPQEALKLLVSELRPKVDVLVVLAHMPYPVAEQIFQRFPEVDVVILGCDIRLTKKEDTLPGPRALVETGTSGQYMTISEFRGGQGWKVSHVPIDEKIANHPELWQRYQQANSGAVGQASAPGTGIFESHMSADNGTAGGPTRVPLAIFKSESCVTCKIIEPDNLTLLGKRLGCRIDPRYFYLDHGSEYELLIQLERKFNKTGNELPVVFIGPHVLGGPKEIEARLADYVKEYARSKRPETPIDVAAHLPISTAPTFEVKNPLYIAYFDEPGCRGCRRVKYALERLTRTHPNVRVKTFDVSKPEDRLLQEALSEKIGVPLERRLLTPTVIVGSDASIKDDVTDATLDKLVQKYAESGAGPIWDQNLDFEKARLKVRERFRSLGLIAITLGGLADGINPCAFSTLILFVSFLRAVSSTRKEVLAIGFSFAAGVFAAYLAAGMGLTQAVRWMSGVPLLSTIVTWGIVTLCGVLAILSVWDAVQAARGHLKEMTLQLPEKSKETIKKVLIRFRRTRHLIIGAFVAGTFISMLELACTGQVYLPIIKLMLATAGNQQLKAFLLLLYYNACFIVPLLLVLAIVYYGTTSKRLTDFFRKRAVFAKGILAGVFTLLFALLIIFVVIGVMG